MFLSALFLPFSEDIRIGNGNKFHHGICKSLSKPSGYNHYFSGIYLSCVILFIKCTNSKIPQILCQTLSPCSRCGYQQNAIFLLFVSFKILYKHLKFVIIRTYVSCIYFHKIFCIKYRNLLCNGSKYHLCI